MANRETCSIELVIGMTPLLTSFWYAPWSVAGIILASMSGFLLHVVPGRWLLVMCAVTQTIAVLLFAIMPPNPSYWAWVFPAMVAEAACVDVIYTATNVFITTNLPSHRQGMAGSLINCTLFMGICVFLALADVAVAKTTHLGLSTSYKAAFWIGVGFAALCLVLFATMDIGSAKSDYTKDEKLVLEGAGSLETVVSTPVEEKKQACTLTVKEIDASDGMRHG